MTLMLFGQIRLAPFFLLFLAATPTNATFTRLARWKLDTVEQTYAGAWCYRPRAISAHVRPCTNATLNALLDAHTNNEHGAGLSIAYYDPQDSSILGGAGWASWDTVTLPVGLCMTGTVDGTNAYSTICRFSFGDDDHDTRSAHVEECAVNHSQLRVIDGCYTPPRRSRFRLDDSTSGILTIIGLLIALPGLGYGVYRKCRARRARLPVKLEEGQVPLPLAQPGRGGRRRCQGEARHERAHSESSSTCKRFLARSGCSLICLQNIAATTSAWPLHLSPSSSWMLTRPPYLDPPCD